MTFNLICLAVLASMLLWSVGATVGWWHQHSHDIDPDELLQHFTTTPREDSQR